MLRYKIVNIFHGSLTLCMPISSVTPMVFGSLLRMIMVLDYSRIDFFMFVTSKMNNLI